MQQIWLANEIEPRVLRWGDAWVMRDKYECESELHRSQLGQHIKGNKRVTHKNKPRKKLVPPFCTGGGD